MSKGRFRSRFYWFFIAGMACIISVAFGLGTGSLTGALLMFPLMVAGLVLYDLIWIKENR